MTLQVFVLLTMFAASADDVALALTRQWGAESPLQRLSVRYDCSFTVSKKERMTVEPEMFPRHGFTEATSGIIPRKSYYLAWSKTSWRCEDELMLTTGKAHGFEERTFDGNQAWLNNSKRNCADRYRNADTRYFRPEKDFYGDAIGWPCPHIEWDNATMPGELRKKEPFALCDLIPSGKYRVQDKIESIDGNPCRVLIRDDLDKVWLGTSIGYAVVRREWNWLIGRQLKCRITNADFRKVAENLWLPFRSKIDFFGHPQSKHNRLVVATTLKVTELSMNVPDEVFKVRIAPGTMVRDNVRNKQFRADFDENGNMLEKPLNYAKARPHWYREYWKPIAAASIATVAIVVGFIWLRRRRAG